MGRKRALALGASLVVALCLGLGLVWWTRSSRGWKQVPSGTRAALRGIWGSSATYVWAVGDRGTIVHWDGDSWTSVPSGTTKTLRDVWGSSRGDAWVVGDGGTVLHWNATSWTAVSSGTEAVLDGVWAASANDAWAVGNTGTVLRWDGTAWSSLAREWVYDNHAVCGVSPSDVWIAGGSVFRWDGGRLGLEDTPGFDRWLSVWCSSDSVWVVGERFSAIRRRGGRWSRVATKSTYGHVSSSFFGVFGFSQREVWVVGSRGTVLRWDGESFDECRSGTDAALMDVWGASPDDVWAVGMDGAILRGKR